MKLKNLLPRLLLILLGFGCAATLALLSLQLFPELRPGGQRFIFRERDGDAFYHQPGFVRPPEGNAILEDFIVRRDENGFRQPRQKADFYPILVLGDSYSEGGAVPWVDVLAEELDTPVQNLAFRGFGPVEYAEVMRQYGDNKRDWVLIGYFEGNDLSNARTAYQAFESSGAINISRDEETTAEGVENRAIVEDPDDNYLYPLSHEIDGQRYELAYISDYIWWLNGERAVYESSRNVEILRESLRQIKQSAGTACTALVYMPNKGHIYFRYADSLGNRRYVLENALELVLGDDGWLSFRDAPLSDFDALYSRFDNQRDLLRAIAAELDLFFIDLTPAFQSAVHSGAPTYYTYDSHWDQRGHDLAGKTVANYLREAKGC